MRFERRNVEIKNFQKPVCLASDVDPLDFSLYARNIPAEVRSYFSRKVYS